MISSLELARICGVSQSTVDRAIHGRSGISVATKERILAAAASHGYCPNPAAREMISGTSIMVGAIVPSLSSVFFMELMDAVRQALASHGLSLLLAQAGNDAEFVEALGDMAARRMRAAVVISPSERFPVPELATRQMKLVTLINSCSRGLNRVNHRFVAPDEKATGADAAEYLLSKGHRRILHLTYERDSEAIRNRRIGYEEAMIANGYRPVVIDKINRESLLAAIKVHQPTALFCHNDWLALSSIRILGSAGTRVPQEISVLGVDNSKIINDLELGLTTLAYPSEQIAGEVAGWIANGKEPAPIKRMRVVERETIRSISER